MKAVIVDRPGDESVLRVGETDAPVLGAREVRIRVRTTAVNRADLLQRQGLYPPPPGASPILGLECCGEVSDIGAEVSGMRRGERVMALLAGGGYAEEVVVDVGSVMRVPEALSDEQAGALPEVFLTVFLNVFQIGAAPEKGTVLVHGGGSGVGTAAISLCREAGVRVLVTAGTEEKCARCVDLGAEAAFDYRQGAFAPWVREQTAGRGVDVVLDCVGARYLGENLCALATGGRLVVIGLIGGARGEINLAELLTRRLQVVGSTLRARPAAEKAEIVRAFLARFGAAIAAGRVRPVIDRVYALDEIAAAHRLVGSGGHFGKVALRVSG